MKNHGPEQPHTIKVSFQSVEEVGSGSEEMQGTNLLQNSTKGLGRVRVRGRRRVPKPVQDDQADGEARELVNLLEWLMLCSDQWLERWGPPDEHRNACLPPTRMRALRPERATVADDILS